jgi:hypothetical protein
MICPIAKPTRECAVGYDAAMLVASDLAYEIRHRHLNM